jgi:hypothetical protein
MFRKINKVFAYVSIGRFGEGVITCLDEKTNQWLPLVGADLDRVKSLRPFAKRIARETGVDVMLIEFTSRREVERFKAHEHQEQKI